MPLTVALAARRPKVKPDDESLPLDAWERYRALNATMDEAYELIDIHNREARFALILMSGLNAAVVVAGTRSDLLASHCSGTCASGSAGFSASISLVALYYLLQAVEALRPGHFRPQLGSWPKDRHGLPEGRALFRRRHRARCRELLEGVARGHAWAS